MVNATSAIKLGLAGLAFAAWSGAAHARTAPPLKNPALLNIGFVCRWQANCMETQEKAMRRSLKFVAKYQPETWRIQLCNRNASRTRTRVDWVGYYNCIRNPDLRPPPAPKKRRRQAVAG